MLRLLSAKQAAPRASSLLFPALRSANVAGLRRVSSERITADNEQQILVEQRKNRPMSPHLEIYQPQLTWYLSGLHRITGVGLAFGFVGGLAAYATFPLIGYPFTFAEVAEYWGSFSPIVKTAVKAGISFPFTFHSWNGIRHLIWDSGRELTLKGVYRTGYVVLGLSALSSIGLALL